MAEEMKPQQLHTYTGAYQTVATNLKAHNCIEYLCGSKEQHSGVVLCNVTTQQKDFEPGG